MCIYVNINNQTVWMGPGGTANFLSLIWFAFESKTEEERGYYISRLLFKTINVAREKEQIHEHHNLRPLISNFFALLSVCGSVFVGQEVLTTPPRLRTHHQSFVPSLVRL